MQPHNVTALKVKQSLQEGARLGTIVDYHEESGIVVDFEKNPFGPLTAKTVIPLSIEDIEQAIKERREVLLVFNGGEFSSPIIVGLVQPLPPKKKMGDGDKQEEPECQVDGKRIVIRGQEEVVLRCGQASISLHRDGKLIVRGIEIHSRALGQNRITGGVIKIN